MDFVDRLKKIIADKGLSNEEFALKVGVSRSQIFKYVKGEQEPGTKFYRGIKDSFSDVNLNWLISGFGEYNDQNTNDNLTMESLKKENSSSFLNKDFENDSSLEIEENLQYIKRESGEAYNQIRDIIKGVRLGITAKNQGDRRKKSIPHAPDRRKMVS